MAESIWFTTRSLLFRPGDAAWNEVARYGEPLQRLVARRYRWLDPSDRDDLVQDILLEMKEKLVAGHDRSRGRFRALLQTVVKRRVADRLRRARPDALPEEAAGTLAAPPEEEVEALDLETALLEAVSFCRDRFTQGPHQDLDVLYALVDRLIHQKSSTEIARSQGVSRDRVARLLRKARDAVFLRLLGEEMGLSEQDRPLHEVLDVFRKALRRPGDQVQLLDELVDPKLRERLETFLNRFRAALPLFQGDQSQAGQELARGVELIFHDVDR